MREKRGIDREGEGEREKKREDMSKAKRIMGLGGVTLQSYLLSPLLSRLTLSVQSMLL